MAYPPPYYGGVYPQPAYPGAAPPYGAGYPGVAPPVAAGYPYPSTPTGRTYYYIRSRMNGMVLAVDRAQTAPGTRCTVRKQKQDGHADNHLWYDDFATGTIRSKLHEYCLDLDDNIVVLRPYYQGNPNQQWEKAESFIRNRMNPNRVLDIANCNNAPGAHLVAWDRNGGVNQCFDFQIIDLAPVSPPPKLPPARAVAATPSRRLFYIASDMHNKVLDIKGGSSAVGTPIIVWPRKSGGECRNQLWYFDQQGIIRSALHDFALTAHAANVPVCVTPLRGAKAPPEQQWRLVGNRIMKNQNECLDICGASRDDGAAVLSYQYKGSSNQHWHIGYV